MGRLQGFRSIGTSRSVCVDTGAICMTADGRSRQPTGTRGLYVGRAAPATIGGLGARASLTRVAPTSARARINTAGMVPFV